MLSFVDYFSSLTLQLFVYPQLGTVSVRLIIVMNLDSVVPFFFWQFKRNLSMIQKKCYLHYMWIRQALNLYRTDKYCYTPR